MTSLLADDIAPMTYHGDIMTELTRLHRFNVEPGPHFESADALPDAPPATLDVRLIAFYLPQFHAIPENDVWWGKNFTEWTNVTRALPRFSGHQQPRLPGDLGFYNLRDPEVLRTQAALARRAGVHGFCFHNYWFSGRTILEGPIETLLADRSIDLPFCIDWANESWTRRWDGAEQDILLEQRYASGDAAAYAEYLERFLRDPRYIHVDGRPLIMFYRPAVIPDAPEFVGRFRERLQQLGFANPYMLMVRSFWTADPRPFDLDAAVIFPPHRPGRILPNDKRWVNLFDANFWGSVISYDTMAQDALSQEGDGYTLFPGLVPSWDNEARKPGRGLSTYGHNPGKYGAWLREACEKVIANEPPERRMVFVNAWNEWAEGAYLEPDRHFGYGYLAETRRIMEGLGKSRKIAPATPVGSAAFQTRKSFTNLLRNVPTLAKHRIFGPPDHR